MFVYVPVYVHKPSMAEPVEATATGLFPTAGVSTSSTTASHLSL